MTMILKFFKDEKGMIDGLEAIFFQKGKVYAVPEDLAESFIRRGSAVEIMVELMVARRGLLVGTQVSIVAEEDVKPPPPAPSDKRTFFQIIFNRNR
jgi:hypothetical protein